MAKKSKSPSIDLAALQRKVQAQFTGLDPNDPSLWPSLPRYLLLAVAGFACVLILFLLMLL